MSTETELSLLDEIEMLAQKIVAINLGGKQDE